MADKKYAGENGLSAIFAQIKAAIAGKADVGLINSISEDVGELQEDVTELQNGLISRAVLSAVTTNGDSFEVINPNQNGNYYTYGIVVGGFSTRFAAYIIRCGVNADEIVATPLTTNAGTMTFTRSGSTITIACSTTFYGGVRVIWLG